MMVRCARSEKSDSLGRAATRTSTAVDYRGAVLGGLFCILSRLHFMGIIAQLVHFMVPGFSKMASCYFLQLIVSATARLWAMYCLIRIPCAYAQVLSLRD